METYNGWKNKETWLVSLTINNNYGLYQSAREFMKKYKGNKPYRDFVDAERLDIYQDGAMFTNPNLSLSELNFMMKELGED